MNISKHFNKNGSSQMTQCQLGYGVNYLDKTVRLTLHKSIDNTMAHVSLSPEEARDLARELIASANKLSYTEQHKAVDNPSF